MFNPLGKDLLLYTRNDQRPGSGFGRSKVKELRRICLCVSVYAFVYMCAFMSVFVLVAVPSQRLKTGVGVFTFPYLRGMSLTRKNKYQPLKSEVQISIR